MPERLNVVAAVLARWSQDIPAGEDVLAGIATDRAVREARRQAATAVSCGGIAELPLYGVITQWCLADAFRSIAGVCSRRHPADADLGREDKVEGNPYVPPDEEAHGFMLYDTLFIRSAAFRGNSVLRRSSHRIAESLPGSASRPDAVRRTRE